MVSQVSRQYCLKTSGTNYPAMRCHIPEEQNLQLHHRKDMVYWTFCVCSLSKSYTKDFTKQVFTMVRNIEQSAQMESTQILCTAYVYMKT